MTGVSEWTPVLVEKLVVPVTRIRSAWADIDIDLDLDSELDNDDVYFPSKAGVGVGDDHFSFIQLRLRIRRMQAKASASKHIKDGMYELPQNILELNLSGNNFPNTKY